MSPDETEDSSKKIKKGKKSTMKGEYDTSSDEELE
jgi:hypothetical protein